MRKITAKSIAKASEVLSSLVLQRKYTHMRQAVQMVLGGLLLPILIDQDEIDPNDPGVQASLDKYSRKNIDLMLNPEPIEIPIEIPVEIIIKERPKFRRVKGEINKEKRKERAITPLGRDIVIRWWNRNQKLVPSDDPICVILTEKINNMEQGCSPISNMQISGYFSELCRRGIDSPEEREAIFQKRISTGLHTLMPYYSQELLDIIEDNWLRARIDEEERAKDHKRIEKMKENETYSPIIANT